MPQLKFTEIEKKENKIIRYPNLNTVLMVEDFLKKHRDMPIKIVELKEKLPKQVMHQTLKIILEYLWKSGKIIYGPKGMQWIYSEPEHLKKMMQDSLEILNKETIIQKIEENREKIKSFGVKKLTLIGSYAHDEAKHESDIDFLVEFEKGRGLFDDYVHCLQFLRDLFGKEIDMGEKRLLREELKPNILGGLGGKKIEAKL